MTHIIYLAVIVLIIVVAYVLYKKKPTHCCKNDCVMLEDRELEMLASNGRLAIEILESRKNVELFEQKYKVAYRELSDLNFFNPEHYGRQLLFRKNSFILQLEKHPDDVELQAKVAFYLELCKDFGLKEQA